MTRQDFERMTVTGALRSTKTRPLEFLQRTAPRSAWLRFGFWMLLGLLALLWEWMH